MQDEAAIAAWLVLAVMAFNLTRAAGLARATMATIGRKLVSVPARIASSTRRITLHLSDNWPWETACTALFDQSFGPPQRTPI